MNVRKSIKKVGAVVGSTLMAGLTLGAATSLADYPGTFVDENGVPDLSIVVGSNGKVSDVIGGINVAASLGQSTVKTGTQTQEVTVSNGVGSYNAVSGALLSTPNQELYLGDALNAERTTLTDSDLDALEEVTFRDDSGDTTDVEFFVEVGDNELQFGQPDGADNQDPMPFIKNVESVDDTEHLLALEAQFDEELDLTAEDAVDSDGLRLFGKEFDVLPDTTEDEIVLGTGRETVEVETGGDAKTVTVDGDEYTVEVLGVTSSDTAAIKVNGDLTSADEDDRFAVGDEVFRLDRIVQTVPETGQGVVEVSVGEDELHLENGAQIEDGDGDDVEGTYVEFNGGAADAVDELSSLTVYVGAQDDDREYVAAGDEVELPVFDSLKLAFDGFTPDARDGGDNVRQVDVDASGDDTLTATVADRSGDEVEVPFAYAPTPESSSNVVLGDDDGDEFVVVEGDKVREDEYVAVDAGDFSHLFEVTSIDRDSEGTLESGDEAVVELKDVVSGDDVEVEVDADGNNYVGRDVIDGKTYEVRVEGAATNDPFVQLVYGDGASATDAGVDAGSVVSVAPALDAGDESATAFLGEEVVATQPSPNTDITVELPSTDTTAEAQVSVRTDTTSPNYISVTGTESTVDVVSDDDAKAVVSVNDGQNYVFETDGAGELTVRPEGTTEPSVVVLQPEDDDDVENAYRVSPSVDTGDEEIEVGDVAYTGVIQQEELESDDDVTAGLDRFGGYTEIDTNDQGSFDLTLPETQSFAGVGLLGDEGLLRAGGQVAQTVEYDAVTNPSMVGTMPSMAATDTQVTQSMRQSQDLILIGGPAVNQLVEDLADADKALTQDEWQSREGEARLNMVEDAFADGQNALIVAGHSAEDTVRASEYLANYRSHAAELDGQSIVTVPE